MTVVFISKLVQSKDVSDALFMGSQVFNLALFFVLPCSDIFFLKELLYTFLLHWTILNLVNTYSSQAQ